MLLSYRVSYVSRYRSPRHLQPLQFMADSDPLNFEDQDEEETIFVQAPLRGLRRGVTRKSKNRAPTPVNPLWSEIPENLEECDLLETVRNRANISAISEMAIAESTKKNYDSAVKRFEEFVKPRNIDIGKINNTLFGTILLFFEHLVKAGRKYGTLDYNRSGLKRFYKRTYGRTANEWRGEDDLTSNPMDHPDLMEFLSGFKTVNALTHTVKQALPIRIEHMVLFHRLFAQIIENGPTKNSASFCPAEAIQLDCMFTVAFLLWTRADELNKLEWDMVTFVDDPIKPYFSIRLTFRKTNQNDPSRHKEYKIYQRSTDPIEIDAFSKLQRYISMLKSLFGSQLAPNERVFCQIKSTKKGPSLSPQAYQKANDITAALRKTAGLAGLPEGVKLAISAHSFRRGGAQYRFMYAPRKWKLQDIQWWADWTNKETMTNYLIQKLQEKEKDEGDLLDVDRWDRNQSILQDFTSNYAANPLVFSGYNVPGAFASPIRQMNAMNAFPFGNPAIAADRSSGIMHPIYSVAPNRAPLPNPSLSVPPIASVRPSMLVQPQQQSHFPSGFPGSVSYPLSNDTIFQQATPSKPPNIGMSVQTQALRRQGRPTGIKMGLMAIPKVYGVREAIKQWMNPLGPGLPKLCDCNPGMFGQTRSLFSNRKTLGQAYERAEDKDAFLREFGDLGINPACKIIRARNKQSNMA